MTATAAKHPARQAGGGGGGIRGPAQRSDVRPAGCARDGRTDRGRQGCALRSARRVSCRTAAGPSPPPAPGLPWRGCYSRRDGSGSAPHGARVGSEMSFSGAPLRPRPATRAAPGTPRASPRRCPLPARSRTRSAPAVAGSSGCSRCGHRFAGRTGCRGPRPD